MVKHLLIPAGAVASARTFKTRLRTSKLEQSDNTAFVDLSRSCRRPWRHKLTSTHTRYSFYIRRSCPHWYSKRHHNGGRKSKRCAISNTDKMGSCQRTRAVSSNSCQDRYPRWDNNRRKRRCVVILRCCFVKVQDKKT
jgi:hypothetical protein